MSENYYINAAGRKLPKEIAGYGTVVPFAGAFATPPPPDAGAKVHPRFYKPGRKKNCESLKEALIKCELKDGAVLSFNHHLRNGDAVVLKVIQAVSELSVKGIVLFASALFDCHSSLIPFIQDGTIGQILGSINGGLGRFVSEGGSHQKPVILRSHGGRAAAVTLGKVVIDICIVTASTADWEGNCNGLTGKNPVGVLGYSEYEIPFAKRSIVVTDTIVEYPLTPPQITLNYVDYVVKVDSIGDDSGISTGSVKIRGQNDPKVEAISDLVLGLITKSDLLNEGVVIQGGAGQMSMLSLTKIVSQMERDHIKAAQITGGTTAQLVEFLRKGVVNVLTTGQSFDTAAVESLVTDYPRHVKSDVNIIYNPFSCGCSCNLQDFVTLSATEVDVNFNVNVNTHSNGYLLHGIGGHQDAAAGSKLVIVTCPLARKTNPIIVPSVTTVTTPGECVDAVVTEVGIAINPRNKDLYEKLSQYKEELKICTIDELCKMAEKQAGRPYEKPNVNDKIVAVVEWRDQTVLDIIYEVADQMSR